MAEYIEKKGYCEYLATREGDFLDDYGKGWSAAIAEARRIAEKFTVPPAYPVKDRETLIEEAVEGRALRIAADIMAAAGLCRYEERGMCAKWRKNKKRKNEGHCGCENCILRWLKRKAREELKGE